MRLIFKPLFLTMILFIAIFTISCGTDSVPNSAGKSAGKEEQKPIPPPPDITDNGSTPDNGKDEEVVYECEGALGGTAGGLNTAVTVDNLTGGYEIVYFYSFANNAFKPTTIDTGNLASVQDFTGEAAIDVINGKLHLTTKIRLESEELASLAGIAGDQRSQFTVYQPIDAISDNGKVGFYDKNIFSDTNYDLRVINDELVLRQQFVQQNVPIVKTANVTLNMKLKKISDNVTVLDSTPYPTFDKPVADETVTPFPTDTTAGLELEKIVNSKWHGQYKIVQIDITKGGTTYSSATPPEIIDYIGEASVHVIEAKCVNNVQVTTKYQVESQSLANNEMFKYDNFTIIKGLQTKEGVIGQYDNEIDGDKNFKMEFIDDNLTITKRNDGIGYKYILAKEDQNVLPINEEVYWPRTSILEGKEGTLGYYRIDALSGYLTSGANKFYGNMLIYVDEEKTQKVGKTVIGMKIRWQSENTAGGMGGWQNVNTWATLNYDKMTDDYSGFFQDIQCSGLRWPVCNILVGALPKPTETVANINFDASNKYRGNRGFDIAGGWLTLYLTKLYDLSPNKTIRDGNYF